MSLKNEIGIRYGLLYVVGRQPRPDTNRAYWFCECDCGNLKPILGDHLRTGAITHCGCQRYVRAATRPPLKPRKTKVERAKKRLERVRPTPHGEPSVRQHAYRTPNKIDMGPIVAAAMAALAARAA